MQQGDIITGLQSVLKLKSTSMIIFQLPSITGNSTSSPFSFSGTL